MKNLLSRVMLFLARAGEGGSSDPGAPGGKQSGGAFSA